MLHQQSKVMAMDKGQMITGIAVLGLVVVSIVLAAAGDEGDDILTVSGEAVLIAAPDQADIYVKILSEEQSATAAKNTNAELSSRVMTALEAAGVQKEDIETTDYYLSKKQDWHPVEGYIDAGYQLVHVLKIRTRDVEDTGSLVDTAVNNGANGLDRVEFSLSEEKQKEVNSQALEQAAGEAAAKAETLAKKLDVRLQGISSVSESLSGGYPYPVYAEAAMEKAATQIAPANVKVSVSVTVNYEI